MKGCFANVSIVLYIYIHNSQSEEPVFHYLLDLQSLYICMFNSFTVHFRNNRPSRLGYCTQKIYTPSF